MITLTTTILLDGIAGMYHLVDNCDDSFQLEILRCCTLFRCEVQYDPEKEEGTMYQVGTIATRVSLASFYSQKWNTVLPTLHSRTVITKEY